MNPRITLATAGRILSQLRHDHRTVALMLLVPCVLLGLLAWIFADSPTPVFDSIGASLLGVFPFVIMFIVTSVSTLRERTGGTLERLMTTPLGKGDLMVGYAIAFGVVAIVQSIIATAFAIYVCGLDISGPVWILTAIALLDALLGTALGLLASGFARTEFQAVQFMPVVIAPQLLLCGIIVPRGALPEWLQWISNVLPASYALEALQQVGAYSEPTGIAVRDIAVVIGFAVLALCLAAATLRRRTP